MPLTDTGVLRDPMGGACLGKMPRYLVMVLDYYWEYRNKEVYLYLVMVLLGIQAYGICMLYLVMNTNFSLLRKLSFSTIFVF